MSVKIEQQDILNDKKIRNKKNSVYALAIMVVLGIIINYFNNKYIYNDIIANNIFIENVDVSNMTKQEAIKLVNQKNIPQSIYLSYEDEKYEIAPGSINLKYNTEEAVEEAFNYTKGDNYFENIKRYFELKNNQNNIELELSYDEIKLSEFIQQISKDIYVGVVDAKVYISNSGGISVTPSIIGKDLDIASTNESIIENIQNKKFGNISLKVNSKEPNITTEEAKSVNSVLATYTTKFSTGATGRVENIKISARATSDVLLMPGEEFSYNNLTGPRNVANGYKDAPVIINGKLEDGIGGGVCQVSTTLYNSILSSGMELTTINNHSLASSYAPLGRDAMVNDGWSDLKFKNPYSNPVYVKNIVGNGTITSKIYGNASDKPNLEIYVDTFKENGLDAAKTYRIYKDSNGNIIEKEYIDKSVYKKPKE